MTAPRTPAATSKGWPPATSTPGSIAAFVSDAARVASEIERRTPLRMGGPRALARLPRRDSRRPGRRPFTVAPDPRPCPTAIEARVHRAPDQPAATDGTASAHNDGVVFRGPVRGRALVGALLAGARRRRHRGAHRARVSRDSASRTDGVTGVRVGGDVVDGRVVLATGGFQHDAAPGRGLPDTTCRWRPWGRRDAPGDGLRMALSVRCVAVPT